MNSLQVRAAAELELRRRGLKSSDPASRAAKLAEGLTDWAKPLLQPYRYKCLYGGRGAGKSVASADIFLIIGLTRKIRVLCAREFQISIKESVHALLKSRIEDLGLSDFYQVQETTITGRNGSGFIFKGIRHNIQSIKSMSGLTHCWIEEAQTISAESWRVLVPTIREEGSEIWVTFNANQESDTVYQQLVANPRTNSYVRKVNWDENPHFPTVLDDERRAMQASDPDAYHHIWEGGFWSKSNAQVLSGKWIVDEFEPGEDWDGPYFGADFGFASDPTTLIKCWVYDRRLWVEYESYAHHLELDATAEQWMLDIPGCEQFAVYADSARPESISYLARHGIPKIVGVKKWAGSVEDGIAHLRSYDKIVIHPRCPKTIEEAKLYCYKVDKLSGEIMPVVVDAHQHCLVADTLIATQKGDTPIEQVKAGDMVLTRAGFKQVLFSGITGHNRQVFTVKTQSGKYFEATENHMVLTTRGFIRVDALRYNDRVLTLQRKEECQHEPSLSLKLSSTKGLTITGIQSRNGGMTEFTISRLQRERRDWIATSIVKSGLITTGRFLASFMFTTKMGIHLTTAHPILSAFLQPSIYPITLLSGFKRIEITSLRILNASVRLLLHGTPLKRVKISMPSWLKTLPLKVDSRWRKSAIAVVARIRLTILQGHTHDSAQTPANQNGGEMQGLMTSTLLAQFAQASAGEANTQELRLAVDLVEGVWSSRIASSVYDLTVEDQHEFFANGVLVHNCIDGIRYSTTPILLQRLTKHHGGAASVKQVRVSRRG